MNDDFFSTVTLDGTELSNLSAQQIKELYFNRQINQNSVVYSHSADQWKMLKRVFDLTQWTSAELSETAAGTIPDQSSHSPVSDSGYRATDSRSDFAAQSQPDKFYLPNSFQPVNADNRNGARQAAIFIVINSMFFMLAMIFGAILESPVSATGAEKIASGLSRSFIPLIIDLLLASRLWKNQHIEATRRWILIRAYFGFIIFGVVVPLIDFYSGESVTSILSFIAALLYLISLSAVLLGKTNPAPQRITFSVAAFAAYFLFVSGSIMLSLVAVVAPDSTKFIAVKSAGKLEQYKIQGSDFQDRQSGAKIRLPDGWSMLDVKNPLINNPEARMIALNSSAQSMAMLEVTPIPANVDFNTAQPNKLLETLTDYAAKNTGKYQSLQTLAESNFRELARVSIYLGKQPAKLLVFEKVFNRRKVKGHLIVTFDRKSIYVLHSWSPIEKYENAQSDFLFLEKSFVIPEVLAEPFSQTAEAGKNRASTPKNF